MAELPASAHRRPPAVPLAATGLGGGVRAGLLGVGGGVVLVPVLVSFFKLPQKRAQATSLVAIVFTALAGAVTYTVSGHYTLVPALLIAVGGIGGSYLGAELAARFSENTIRILFAAVMIVAAARLVFPAPAVASDEIVLGPWLIVGFLVTGVAMGVLSALVGVGGGAILVPILILFFHFEAQTAQGTSMLVMIPIAAMGAWRNGVHGHTDYRAGVLLGLGGVVGSPLGALLAVALPTLLLQRVFACLLFFVAGQMIVTTLKVWRTARRRAAGDGGTSMPR